MIDMIRGMFTKTQEVDMEDDDIHAAMVYIADGSVCPRCGGHEDDDGHTPGSRVGGPDFFVCSNPRKPAINGIELNITKEELAVLAYQDLFDKKCEMCNREYGNHPLITNLRNHNNDLYLHFLCNGDIVELI